jgi:Beta-lactamase
MGCLPRSASAAAANPAPTTARSSPRRPTCAGAPTPPWPGLGSTAGCGCLPWWTTPPPRRGRTWPRSATGSPPCSRCMTRSSTAGGVLGPDVARGLSLRHDWGPQYRRQIASHDFDGHDIMDMDPTADWAGGGLVSSAADLAAFLRALTRGQLMSTGAWSQMTRWQPGPAGFYDDHGLGLGRYRFPAAQVVGHHGVWGAFAFWSPELDAFITGTVNTGRVDRRPVLDGLVSLAHRGRETDRPTAQHPLGPPRAPT